MMNKKIALMALLAAIAAGELRAGTLTNYAVGDVLVCFRKGGNDMVVDAGQVSTFTSASANQRITISQYTGTQLAQVGTNGVSWSAFTYLSDNTLYVTRPRSSINSQTAAWPEKSSSAQLGTAQRMATIPPGAVDELNLMVYPQSTYTATIEEDVSDANPNYTDGVSYHAALAGSYGGNFNGTFAGNPENTTLSTFTSGGQVVRSDFYRMTPSTTIGAVGTYLGYFELNTNGVMTYVAYPSTTPTVASYSRSGTSTTIYYTTGLYGTYTLRGTNNIGGTVAATNWPVIMTLSTGDNSTHSVTFTDTDPNKFYIITSP